MSSSIKIKSICGAVTKWVRIKDIDWDNYIGEDLFCCSNCHLIKNTRDSWRKVYA
jgi:hypothetical protein